MGGGGDMGIAGGGMQMLNKKWGARGIIYIYIYTAAGVFFESWAAIVWRQ